MAERRDHRALDHQTLEFLRIRAVECVVEEGKLPKEVADILGLPVQDIYKWRKMYERGGWTELEAKPIPGRPRKVDPKTEQCIGGLVANDTPQALGFPQALWTREEIAVLIAAISGITLCVASVGNLLHRLRFSCQRPLHRAYEQQRKRIEEWVTVTFPALVRRAKEESALIFFADESGVRSDYHSGTTWAPIGHTPVVTTTGKRFSWNLLAAISVVGKLRFEVTSERLNSRRFIAFLKHLMRSVDRKVFLIVDNASYHTSAETRRFLATVPSDQLEVCFLPPYAQEYNPAELIWNLVKNDEIGRIAVHDEDELRRALETSLRSLAMLPEKITALFHAPKTSYALGGSAHA